MIKINKNHKSINKNINLINPSSRINKIIATGLVISNLFIYSGCNKKVKCDIDDNHAHFYTFSQKVSINPPFGRYISSEKEWYENLSESAIWRTDDYIIIDEEQAELLKFANKNGLFRFDENIETINDLLVDLEDYVEYEVRYHDASDDPLPPIIMNPDLFGMYARGPYTKNRISNNRWTVDPDTDTDNLTGTRRLCKYTFNAYKIEKDSNGKYVLLKSDDVDSFSDLPEGYDYFKWNSAERFYHEEYIYDEDLINEFESAKAKTKTKKDQ